MVHRARLRQRGTRRNSRGADAQALVRASVHGQEPRSGDRIGGEAQGDRAGADLESFFLQFRIGGERHPDQACLVFQQCARPAAQEEDHQPRQGLSRRHRRRGLAHRPPRQSSRLRPAAAGLSARRLPAPLPLRQRRRERGGVREPARRRTRRDDHQGRPGHGGGLHRRAGDGRRRRYRAAPDTTCS